MKSIRNAELLQTIQDLNQKIAQLEQKISQLSRPVIEHVHIEHVYLQNPTLERLEFGLESIDIKELSGALNLGNNFGVNVDKVKERQHSSAIKSKTASQNNSNNIESAIGRTPTSQQRTTLNEHSLDKTATGYTIKINRA